MSYIIKKIFIISILIIFSTSFALSEKTKASWHISKREGGPNGFKYVEEDNDEEFNIKMLDCWEAGKKECKFKNPPIIEGVNGEQLEALQYYAEAQVSLGILSGSYTRVVAEGTNTVEWNFTDEYNGTIIEKIIGTE